MMIQKIFFNILCQDHQNHLLGSHLFRHISFLFLVLTFAGGGKAQQLLSGPMIGSTEHREVHLWMEVDSLVNRVALEYWKPNHSARTQTITTHLSGNHPYQLVNLTIGDLQMGTTYRYLIRLNGHSTSDTFQFETRSLWRKYSEQPPDISFLLGSCNYVNDSLYDRSGEPYGQDPSIFEPMARTSANFMLWLGDNTYLRPADYSSPSGIRYRYHHTRKLAELQSFLRSCPHYAIWDDHDYGPNNSDKSFRLKQQSLETFRKYWGNPTYGLPEHPGIYTKFQRADAEFFLLDDRYYRSPNQLPDSIEGQPNPEKHYLGEVQLEWLKNGLLSSNRTFKFIVMGNQALNRGATGECYQNFSAEFQELLLFLKTHEIEGVLFISGDRHFSEVIRYQPDHFYSLYEFTCSPLTSTPYHGLKETREWDNPQRIEGKILLKRNFGKVKITGQRGNRTVRFSTYDKQGKRQWSFSVHEDSLRVD